MIDMAVMEKFGSTNDALKTFFTGSSDKKVAFCKDVAGYISEGRGQSLRHYRFFAASDLMMDAPPLLPETVPLQAYAQGRIDLELCSKELESIDCAEKFIEEKPCTKEGSKDVKKVVNLAKLQETCLSIGRSYISLRVDAQCNKYNTLKPAFHFDPRDTSMVGRLRAEAMSEYADIMAESMGYKHQQRQAIRGMLVYSRTVMFPASAWERETAIVRALSENEKVDMEQTFEMADKTKLRVESKVVREGVPMTVVHPSMLIYDSSAPLSSVNTDTGCRWVGYWDVKRFGDINDSSVFFNVDKVAISAGASSIVAQNKACFDLIYGDDPLNFPNASAAAKPGVEVSVQDGTVRTTLDAAAANKRADNALFYSQNHNDMAVFVTDVRVKVVPRDIGVGTYPLPVWLRLVVASDDTVIMAEWLPSLPAIYWGHNEDDNKLVNLGMSHEIMPIQDQLTNLLNNMLMVMKRKLVQIVLINTDVLANPGMVAKIEADFKGENFYSVRHLLRISFKKMKSTGILPQNIKMDDIFKVIQSDTIGDSQYVTESFKAVMMLVSLLEKLMRLSPQEQAQQYKTDTSATEIAAIDSTTQVKFNAISESIDEARSAWKRVIFESAQCYGSNQVQLAVTQRFTEDTIKKAGFKVVTEEGGVEADATARSGMTIIGTKRSLVHDYTFSGRDGGNRNTDMQSAGSLVNLVGTVLPLVGKENIGKRQLFEIVTEIFRRLGVYDLKLQVQEGESDQFVDPTSEVIQQKISQLEQLLSQTAAQSQENAAQVRQLVQALRQANGTPEQAAPAPAF